ncbi:MAG: hypothetical protein BGO29_09390 [Bacteroidales bacterium 36-12]|nr:MAG: hypothetical protein BGO29_09390 [Bacteroidales bacterium 36-12]
MYVLISKGNTLLIKYSGILLAIFLGCINSTKIPENDMYNYLSFFDDAGEYSYIDYINHYNKEQVFFSLNYLLYILLDGSKYMYIFTLTVISYIFLNTAVYKLSNALNLNKSIQITSIYLMSFTPYIFTISAQLIRQFIAGSILIYIITDLIFYGKKSWILSICMVLIHSTSLLFIPLLYIPYFKKKPNKKTYLFYFIVIFTILGIQKVADSILGFTSGATPLNYALERASSSNIFEAKGLNIINILVTISLSLITIFITYISKTNFKNDSRLIHFTNIVTLLVLFILGNLSQAHLSSRFNIYTWLLFPLIFTMSNIYKNVSPSKLTIITLSIMVFFIYYLDAGTWTYTIGNKIYYYTIFNYLIK